MLTVQTIGDKMLKTWVTEWMSNISLRNASASKKMEWMKWQTVSLCCQSRIVRIVEIWTHYPAGCLQGTFKIWQKGNSWFNFGRVVKTVKRICPTSIKRGDRLVGLPTCFKRHLPLSDLSADVNQSNCSGHRLKKVPSLVLLGCESHPKWMNIMCNLIDSLFSAFPMKLNLFKAAAPWCESSETRSHITSITYFIAVWFILHFKAHYIC